MLSFLKRLVSRDKTINQHTPLLPPTPKLSTRRLTTSYQTLAPASSGYNMDMELYLEECKAAPLSREAAARIQNSKLLCNLTFSTPVIPVLLNGNIFDLSALEALPDFNNEDGFQDPLKKKNKRYLKKDLVAAREARGEISGAINAAALRAGSQSPRPAQWSEINNSHNLFQFEEPAEPVQTTVGKEKSSLLGFKH